MKNVEDSGFALLCTERGAMSLAEGLTLGAGAVVAIGLSWLASSRSLSEEMSFDDYAAKLFAEGVFPYGPSSMRNGARNLFDRGFSIGEARKILTNHALGYEVSNPNALKSEKYYHTLKKAVSRSSGILELVARMRVDQGPVDKVLRMTDEEADEKVRILDSYGGRDSFVNDKTLKIADFWYRNGFRGEDLQAIRDIGGFGLMTNTKDRTPEGIEALRTIAKRFKGAQNKNAFSMENIFSEKDYIVLASLPFDKLPDAKFLPTRRYIHGKNFDWLEYVEDVKELATVPETFMKDAHIDPSLWIKAWRTANKSEENLELFYKLAAVGSIVGAPNENMKWFFGSLWDLATKADDDEEPFFQDEAKERIDALAKMAKSGLLNKIQESFVLSFNANYPENWKIVADAYIKHGPSIFEGGWKSYGDLFEKIAIADFGPTGSDPDEAVADYEESKINRVRDRLAARDPEWAISQFKNEYDRGMRIAPLLREVVNHIEEMVMKGETIVVHGRDGELIYEMLMRRPGIRKDLVRYAITSRPLTVFSSAIPADYEAQIPQNYRDYLGRMVPKGAVHIDTGFQGSIPRWLDDRGFEVKKIQMVSATRPEEQIPIDLPIPDNVRRDIVLSDLEHSSQRLENPLGGWGKLRYSYGAPGYHARKYGVYDALGIPRLQENTPATNFEEKRRYRIADEPLRNNDEDMAIESSQTKAFK